MAVAEETCNTQERAKRVGNATLDDWNIRPIFGDFLSNSGTKDMN
jgi:hypothetical protein